MHPSFPLNTADYLIIATVVISAVVGMVRGLLREVIAVATWLVAAFVAWHFSVLLEPHLGGLLAQDMVRPWAARAIVFAAMLLLGHAVGWIVDRFVRLSLLTGVDRFLGLVFGLVRGILVVGAGVIACQTVRLDTEAWWHESTLIPYGQDAAALLWSLGGSRFKHSKEVTASLVAP